MSTCLIIINDWNENGIDITTRSASLWGFPVFETRFEVFDTEALILDFYEPLEVPLKQEIFIAIPFKGYLTSMIAGVVLSNVVG